jgi:hypothetical protein
LSGAHHVGVVVCHISGHGRRGSIGCVLSTHGHFSCFVLSRLQGTFTHHLNCCCRKICILYTLLFQSDDTCQSTASEYARTRLLPLATSMALRLAVNLHPPDSAGSSAQRLLVLLPPEPLRAPTAQGYRCCRERDAARRYGGVALARAPYPG